MMMSLLVATPAPASWTNFTFDDFTAQFAKTYTNDEISHRRQTFEASKAFVLQQNAEYAAGRSTWFASINSFSDMTDAEFSTAKKGRSPSSRFATLSSLVEAPALVGTTPDAVDWRTKTSASGSPLVTPVKNQGMCGSCWAFASTAVIETYYAISTNKLDVLAPQTLVDCAPNPDDCGGTGGCEGSIPELAYNYTKHAGMATEADLPYKGHDQKCPQYTPKVTLDGYVKLPANSASALEAALGSIGTVAVNVAADWQHYGGGIFSGGCRVGKSCTIDHVVVATGYRKQDATTGEGGYWLIRNSWGPIWGEKGYIRLTRKEDDTTFVDSHPSSGVACKPFPKHQNVSGESGLLVDMSYPTGVGAWRA